MDNRYAAHLRHKVAIKILKTFDRFGALFYRPMSRIHDECANSFFKNSIGILGVSSRVNHAIYLINPRYCEVGDHFSAGPSLRLEAWDSYCGKAFIPKIIIKNNVGVGHNVHIGAINRIEIHDGALIGSNVLITDHSHGDNRDPSSHSVPVERDLISSGPVIINKNVWICENACILPGVTIGEGAVIACNAVVNKDVPPFALVAGVPASVVKMLKYERIL